MENQTDLHEISLNGYIFTFTDKSEWICKAMPDVPVLSRKNKKDTSSKFPVQNNIEKDYADEFEKCLVVATKDIAKYLMG